MILPGSHKILLIYLLICFKFVFSRDQTEESGTRTNPSVTNSGPVFEKDDKYLKYGFESDFRCVGVKYDGKEVWKRDASKPNEPYPKSVFLVIKGNSITVNFKESFNVFRLENDMWKSTYSGNITSNCLDIRNTSSTDMSNYEKVGKLKTFTAKADHPFDSVMRKGDCWFHSDESIWNADYSDDIATKVEFNDSCSNKIVTIHHMNGLTTTFKRKSCGNWEESEVKDSGSELTEDKVDILTEGKSVSSEPNEIPDQTNLDTHVPRAESPSENEQSNLLSASKPTGTVSHTKNADVVKMMEGETKAFEEYIIMGQDGEIPVPPVSPDTLPEGKIAVHLDVRTRKSTEQFEYSQAYRFCTYIAKVGYFFSSLHDGNILIYTRSYIASAKRIIAELDSSLSLVGLTLHFVNGETKKFKISDGKVHEFAYRNPLNDHPFSKGILLVDPSAYTCSQPEDESSSLKEPDVSIQDDGTEGVSVAESSSHPEGASESVHEHHVALSFDKTSHLESTPQQPSASETDIGLKSGYSTTNLTSALVTCLSNEGFGLQP